MKQSTKNLAVAGLVLGIVATVVAIIPLIGWLIAGVLFIIGATLSGVSLSKAHKDKEQLKLPIIAVGLSATALMSICIWGSVWLSILAVDDFEKDVKSWVDKMAEQHEPSAPDTTVYDAEFGFRLHNLQCSQTSFQASDKTLVTSKNGHFCVLTFTAYNTEKEQNTIDSADQRLLATNTTETKGEPIAHEPISSQGIYLPNSCQKTIVLPQQKQVCRVYFDVAKDTQFIYALFHADFLSFGNIVQLKNDSKKIFYK